MSNPSDDQSNNRESSHNARAISHDSTQTVSPSGLVDLTVDLSELPPAERELRRKALRSMLAATKVRQEHLRRTRIPALTPGLLVTVKSGPFRRLTGTVLDADFIHSRVQLNIEGQAEAQWVEFARIAPYIEDD